MRNDSVSISILQDQLSALHDAAAAAGIDLPGISRFAPKINVDQPIRTLALQIGQHIKYRNIFIRSAGDVVTVNAQTGKMQAMTPKRFIGFLEESAVIESRGARSRESLLKEEADVILGQDIFLECLRPLDAVHTIRLPVMRASGEVEFLPEGYDPESRIYTVDLLPYPMDWTAEKGRDYLMEICSEVPWNGIEEQEGEKNLALNRSFAVHVAAMVGTYCRALFPPGTLRPMIAYFANKPGTGKTRMVEMVLAPVYGYVSSTTAPKDQEKMDVKLETIARAMLPYVAFDDIGGSLRSNALNKFISATRHSGRCYNSNSEFFDVPQVTQIFATANELPTSEDLGRRFLVAELFLAEEVRGRKFKRTITPSWLAAPETRKDFLAALCAFVRHWIADGAENGGRFLHPTPLETFEEWTSVIGGIVATAGIVDPLAKPEMDVGGATSEDEIKQLLIVIASDEPGDTTVTRQDLVDAAREHGLLEDLVGASGELDDTMNKRFGRRMQRWRGQKLRDSKGRVFQFSHKRKKSGATYPLTFVKG